MELDGKINGVGNEIVGEENQIKIEVTTNSSDDEQSDLDHNYDDIENHRNMVNNNISKEEFMKNSDLKLKINETCISSKRKMEAHISSKSQATVNGQSSFNNALSTPKTNEKKPGARFSTDLSAPLNPKKIAKMSPRATRSSQNPDFAAKQRKFLNRVHDPIKRDYSDGENSQENGSPSVTKNTKEKKSSPGERRTDPKKKSDKEATSKRMATEIEDEEEGSPSKKKRTKEPTKVVGGVDSYCWRCHRDGCVIRCGGCPRVYHLKCVQLEEAPAKGWVCPECITLMQAENTDTRSRAMRMLSLDQLCNLLRHALTRMKTHEGAGDFARAVDVLEFPQYRDYIVKPMDLSQLERNIKTKTYGSTEAFLADAKWIVHNSIIFNSAQSQFTNAARGILKICRQEMQEIENCPDCYQNAHTRSSDSWFIEACRRPHVLVWAKLKGFPFWPAKAMSTNSEGLVDVRFFGAHDRAWVPVNCCYLFSKQSPVPASNKNRRNLEECLEELETHIKKLRDKFGHFEYPPFKTPFDPKQEEAQLAIFLPKKDQLCSKCQIAVDNPGEGRDADGGVLCGECSRLRGLDTSSDHSEYKKVEGMNNESMKESLTIPRKMSKGDESLAESDILNEDERIGEKDVPPEMTPADSSAEDTLLHTPTDTGDTRMDYAPIDSPPKFVIPKTNLDTSKPSKKTNSIVDYLHEKICFAVEEAIKHSVPVDEAPLASTSLGEVDDQLTASEPKEMEPQVTEDVGPIVTVSDPVSPSVDMIADTVQPSVAVADPESPTIAPDTVLSPIESVVDSEQQPASPVSKEILPQSSIIVREPVPIPQIVLHDLKNDKLMLEKLKEREAKKIVDSTKESEVEIHTLSETSSDADISIECEMVTGEENDKKKKHIDSVVRNLTERKNSVDERTEQHDKSPNAKDGNAIILDDNNDDVSVMIIDESESNSPDSKSSDKSDKSRRKGIPAKVLSRSSSSTESSPSDELANTRLTQDVLDEVSGKFRRSSEDSNVTITVVTDNAPPPKKTNQIRTVNISKSLSLSVVNESTASLEMECITSDLEEQVVIDPIVKKLKPTARKTLPRPSPPSAIDLPVSPTSGKTNDPDVVALTPSLFPPRQQNPRVYKSSKTHHSGPPGLMSITTPVPPARAEETTSACDQVKEACKKMSGTLTTVVMDTLRGLSEGGHLGATVKLLQIDLEQQRARHKHEMNEVIHNADMSMREHKALLEADKQRELLDAKHKFEMEMERMVQETKRKTWCTFCPKEATLYCCWNTAYCSYTCQQAHWTMHLDLCSNKQQPDQLSRALSASQPSFKMPPPQRMRQMMPPPVNPSPFCQPYRPNQMYTVGPRFTQAMAHPRPLVYSARLDGQCQYPRGAP